MKKNNDMSEEIHVDASVDSNMVYGFSVFNSSSILNIALMAQNLLTNHTFNAAWKSNQRLCDCITQRLIAVPKGIYS